MDALSTSGLPSQLTRMVRQVDHLAVPTATRRLPTQQLLGVRYFDSAPDDPGDAVVLLHGLGNSLDYWILVAPRVAAEVRTLAVDIPGYGRSRTPSDGMSLQAVVEDLRAFLDELGVVSPALVGHSMGGSVALALAAGSDPPFVCLVGGPLLAATRLLRRPGEAFQHPQIAFNLFSQFVGGLLPLRGRGARAIARSALLRRACLWPFVHEPEKLDGDALAAALSANSGRNVLATASVGRHLDVDTLFASVGAPVIVARGAHDRLVAADDVQRARSRLRIIDDVVITGCGHWPMLEKPEELARVVTGGFELD